MGIGENVGENVGENTGQQGSSLLVPAPTYTPIVADDMESYTGYSTPPANNAETDELFGSSWSTRSICVTSKSHSGVQSHGMEFLDGANFYGGTVNLPSTVTVGDTIWYRAYFYFPETLSFSGGAGSDFFGQGKFMELSPTDHAPPRVYLQLPSTRYADYGDEDFAPSGIYITNDGGITTCGQINSGYTLPRDQWFALQYALKLSTTDGWFRVWSDNTYLGGCSATVPAGYTIGDWGIGNYWNGENWVQGSSTGYFWMDDVIITKEEPNTKDSGGRPYIHPNHKPSEFS